MNDETAVPLILEKIAFVWIHTTWLICGVGLIYFIGTKIVRTATSRYRLGILALLAILICPAVPALWERPTFSNTYHIVPGPAQTSPEEDEDFASRSAPISVDLSGAHSNWKTGLAVAWITGIALFSLRFIFAAIQLNSWRKHGSTNLPPEIIKQFKAAEKTVRMKKSVKLITHSAISVPITFGWISPIVIIPCATFTALPPEHLQMILVHELVHIRNRDYLVCLLQTVVETLFFYHPLAWLVSRRVRIDREFACDETVVSLLENRVDYASALLKMESLRNNEDRLLAPAATDSGLIDRIKAILHPAQPQLSSSEWLVIPVGLTSALIAVGFWFTGLSTAQDKTENKNWQPKAWYPSGTKGRERQLAEKILQGEDGELKHLAFATVVRRWIATDPDDAITFANSYKDPQVKQSFYLSAAPVLVKSDPEKVITTALANQWWPDQYFHVNQAIGRLASIDLDKAKKHYLKLKPKLQGFDGGRGIARKLSDRDGYQAGMKFSQQITSQGGKEGAVRGTMHIWVQDDEPAAVAYVEDLKNGRDKSVAILGMLAGKGRTRDPAATLEWVKELPDDRIRRMALVNLAWLWSLEKNQPEIDRILNDSTIPREDLNVIEKDLTRIGIPIQ